jgi:hypothetical protein
MAVRLLVLHTGRALFPRNIIFLLLALIYVTGRVNPRAVGRIRQIEKKMNSPHRTFEPATFRLVTKYLNNYATACRVLIIGTTNFFFLLHMTSCFLVDMCKDYGVNRS